MTIEITQKRPNTDGTFMYNEVIYLEFMPIEIDEATKLMETIVSHSKFKCEASMTMSGEGEEENV